MRDEQGKNLPGSSAAFPHAPGGCSAPPATARHPLDDEAERLCCMISDLRLHADLCRQALTDLMRRDEGEYTAAQWQDAVNYLTESALRFTSAAEARRYAERWLRRNARKR